jgi:hypothetical protein
LLLVNSVRDSLTPGKANKLRGRYIDVEHNIQEWVDRADEVLEKDLNHLRVEFLEAHSYGDWKREGNEASKA